MATTTGLSAPDLRLATAIETAAYALTHETIEAAPGGEGNTAKLGLALYDVIAAVDAYAAAYMRLGTEPEPEPEPAS